MPVLALAHLPSPLFSQRVGPARVSGFKRPASAKRLARHWLLPMAFRRWRIGFRSCKARRSRFAAARPGEAGFLLFEHCKGLTLSQALAECRFGLATPEGIAKWPNFSSIT